MIWECLWLWQWNQQYSWVKNFQNNQNSTVNTADVTLKHMFDISAKLVADQDEISGLETIGSVKHSWKYLSLIGDERIINLQRTKVYVFTHSVMCLGKIHQNPESKEAWKKRIEWITTSQSYRNFDGINGEPTELEWNIFPGFTTLQLCGKVTVFVCSRVHMDALQLSSRCCDVLQNSFSSTLKPRLAISSRSSTFTQS